ncbi:preprotein translocase subunit YajC [Loigolactobacillus backii]|uniref:preprotein translocase subunit YajC n=1 Tax=Loigolactobacillus backii TaxID=375175 RepID=UPI0007F120EB|nr:preprotein translocase subunit YajC [Loigolactobacillus backii]ANK59193.1 preprotein translocase subunit YajC [Loigolactobacillus backii]ANK64183.1 preprotein translocase subunit YajC [Loigolactobacillus backii]ANK67422.1 preprotein translocase subunit YajC [Loigolactobacillus backii]OLF70631.1 preprotein translocase subunit YajC [Loigolactobacillus backii]PIO83145.1 preprotein translocase subunit YajC [Loigolactobacillus backii]
MNSGMSSIIMIVILFALMYFMMIRPQKKSQDKKKQMMSAMKPGDEVVTIGGLHGVISKIDNTKQTAELDIEGVYLTFDLRAIGRVVNQSTPTNVEEATPTSDEAKPSSEEAEAKSEVPYNEDEAKKDDQTK